MPELSVLMAEVQRLIADQLNITVGDVDIEQSRPAVPGRITLTVRIGMNPTESELNLEEAVASLAAELNIPPSAFCHQLDDEPIRVEVEWADKVKRIRVAVRAVARAVLYERHRRLYGHVANAHDDADNPEEVVDAEVEAEIDRLLLPRTQ